MFLTAERVLISSTVRQHAPEPFSTAITTRSFRSHLHSPIQGSPQTSKSALLCDPVLLLRSALQKVGKSALPCAPESNTAAFYSRRVPIDLSLLSFNQRQASIALVH